MGLKVLIIVGEAKFTPANLRHMAFDLKNKC